MSLPDGLRRVLLENEMSPDVCFNEVTAVNDEVQMENIRNCGVLTPTWGSNP